MSKKQCDCKVCLLKKTSSKNKKIQADESGVVLIEILDPDVEKILKGLELILPPMDGVEVVTVLNNLKLESGINKISKKLIPTDHELWKENYLKYSSKLCTASNLYEKLGGKWIIK